MKTTVNKINSILLCVFNHAKDDRRFKSLDKHKRKFNNYKFTRLNCSIVNVVPYTIKEMININTNLTSKYSDIFRTFGFDKLKIYIVVHPDTYKDFKLYETVVYVNKSIELTILTYNDFFNRIVGFNDDLKTRDDFIKNFAY